MVQEVWITVLGFRPDIYKILALSLDWGGNVFSLVIPIELVIL